MRRLIHCSVNTGEKSKHQYRVNKRQMLLVAELTLLLALCFLHAVRSNHYADFYPINGTFQNYNPVRRLLAGQAPYRDFIDYLGLGHLYVGSLVTGLLGGTYHASLIAYSFLTILSLAMLSILLGKAVIKNTTVSLAVTNVLLLFLLTQPLFFQQMLSGTNEIRWALSEALGSGNSARFVRGLALPFYCALVWVGAVFARWLWKRRPELKKKREYLALAGMSFFAGFAFVWSNDYGISSWLCSLLMIFMIAIARTRKLLRSMAYMFAGMAVSLAGIFICVEIATKGNFQSWFFSTFGTGSYQSWYYNSAKNCYFYNVDTSYLMVVQAFLTVVYLVKIFAKRGESAAVKRYGIPAFVNMTCFCAVNEYQMLSGGGMYEVAYSVLFLTLLYESLCFLADKWKDGSLKTAVILSSLILGTAWVVSAAKEEILFFEENNREGSYIESLGGYVRNLGEDLRKTADFLQNDTFFATYASAQEVLADCFQPSGTDYIIHVLGDSEREKYLESFYNDDFRYTATINASYTEFEYWAQRANWFFYRELYREWHPVYANAYETYWERNEESEQHSISPDIEVSVEDIGIAMKKIMVRTDESISGMADVYLDWRVSKRTDVKSGKLVFQTMLEVQNTGSVVSNFHEKNYLRGVGAEYIPIPISNGYGEVILTSIPVRSTSLEVFQVECAQIYTVEQDYVRITSCTDRGEEVELTIARTGRLPESIANVSEIEVGNCIYQVVSFRLEDDFIYIAIGKQDARSQEEGTLGENITVVRLIRQNEGRENERQQ